MSLPKLPKKNKKSKAVTVRFSVETAKKLKSLATKHNLSQSTVLEILISKEYLKKR